MPLMAWPIDQNMQPLENKDNISLKIITHASHPQSKSREHASVYFFCRVVLTLEKALCLDRELQPSFWPSNATHLPYLCMYI